jgi:hypothetical protein
MLCDGAAPAMARRAKRENGGLGEDPPGSTMTYYQVLRTRMFRGGGSPGRKAQTTAQGMPLKKARLSTSWGIPKNPLWPFRLSLLSYDLLISHRTSWGILPQTPVFSLRSARGHGYSSITALTAHPGPRDLLS